MSRAVFVFFFRMRLVPRSPCFFPSFLPPLLGLLSSLQGFSGHSGAGGYRAGKECRWCGNLRGKHSDSAERGGREASLVASEEGLTFLVEEEEARSVGRGHVFGHVADFEIVHESSEEEQEPYGQKGPLSTNPRSCRLPLRYMGDWQNTHRATGRSTRASTDR